MKTSKLDLNEILNPTCHKKCNKKKREEFTEEGLCLGTNSVLDQLPVRCVREWAFQKIFHLIQYFGIFATGMRNKWEGNINYIEICSGPGRCINRTTGIEFNGTPLSIIEHEAFQYLKTAIFIDYNDAVVHTLNTRFREHSINNAKAIFGNYNEPTSICEAILKETLGKGLNLIFIDPTDCSVPFRLLAELKKFLKNVDFIVNFAIGTDINRNIRNALLYPSSYQRLIEKYKSFLGSDTYFENPEIIKIAETGNNMELRKLFREEYLNSLRIIGYEHFDFKPIENYYDLVFASTHIKGIEFWKKANAIAYDGQRSLFE